jgi:hypothetical protein
MRSDRLCILEDSIQELPVFNVICDQADIPPNQILQVQPQTNQLEYASIWRETDQQIHVAIWPSFTPSNRPEHAHIRSTMLLNQPQHGRSLCSQDFPDAQMGEMWTSHHHILQPVHPNYSTTFLFARAVIDPALESAENKTATGITSPLFVDQDQQSDTQSALESRTPVNSWFRP